MSSSPRRRFSLRNVFRPTLHSGQGQAHDTAVPPETTIAVPIESGNFVIVSLRCLFSFSKAHTEPPPRQNEFFSENGNNLLANVNTFPDLSSSDPSESPTDTQSPTDSLSTLDVGVGIVSSKPITLRLSDFCNLVARHQSLQTADILTTETHAEQIGAITHRFLLLELRRSSGRPIWLRLDRRAGRSAIRIVIGVGVVPAHDVVRCSPSFLAAFAD